MKTRRNIQKEMHLNAADLSTKESPRSSVVEDEDIQLDESSPSSSCISTKENSHSVVTQKRKKISSNTNRNLGMSYSTRKRSPKRSSSAGTSGAFSTSSDQSSSNCKSDVEAAKRCGKGPDRHPGSGKISTDRDFRSNTDDTDAVNDNYNSDKEETQRTTASEQRSAITNTSKVSRRSSRIHKNKVIQGLPNDAEKEEIEDAVGDNQDNHTGRGSSVTSSHFSSERSTNKNGDDIDEGEIIDTEETDYGNGAASDAEQVNKVEDKGDYEKNDIYPAVKQQKSKFEEADADKEKSKSEDMSSDKESEGIGSGSRSKSDDDECSSDDEYVVERIDDKRDIDGAAFYFIKWKGWPGSANTWEPRKNLDGCPELLEQFEKNHSENRFERHTIGWGEPVARGRKRKEEVLEEAQSHMKDYGVLADWKTNIEPISVEGVIPVDGILTYVVKRKVRLNSKKRNLDRTNAVLVKAESFKALYPQLVIKYYESRLVWGENSKSDEGQADVASELSLLRQNQGSALGRFIANKVDKKLREEYKDKKEVENSADPDMSQDEENELVEYIEEDIGNERAQQMDKDHFGLPEDTEETDVSDISESEQEFEELGKSDSYDNYFDKY